MEEGLLVLNEREKEREVRGLTWAVLFQEVKSVGWIAGPMVAVTLSQYLLQVVCTMMVGHLGELSLSSTAIAISLSGVSGVSFLDHSERHGIYVPFRTIMRQ
ncbi:MATE efflux family protein [Actinidia rufa]|uniref:MATE efflux family protein n=1 Tax=Actinidia rufa TaxID=165716 RepID=A0A7J0GZJ1_9ERIC|nr:MATE efflux family protein [Actinidia rufa]